MKLHEKIAYLRRQQGWSQEDLAERLDVSRQSVSKWESGASTPELDRIVEMCRLFGLSTDALIREDIPLDGAELPEPDPDGPPVLTLEDSYAYAAQCQVTARKTARGVCTCILSPALLLLFGDVSDQLSALIGLPFLLLMVAWGVWQFITADGLAERFKYIEKGRFTPAPGVREWAAESREQLRPALTRDVAVGVALCIVSPLPLIALNTSSIDAPLLQGASLTFLLAMIAAGTYLLVLSSALEECYQRLSKKKKKK